MKCQQCGTQNDAAGQRCVKCGAALTPGKPRTPVVVAHVYAGFWKRFAAFIIDYIVVIIVAMGVGAAVGFIYGVANGLATGGEIAGTIAGFMAFCLYYVLMESSRTQATLGKLALGIRVTDMRGARISVGRATWRLIAKLISGMTLMFGYLMAGFTEKKQALQDMLADTLVVNKNATEAELQAGVIAPPTPGWTIALVVVCGLGVPITIVTGIAIPQYQYSLMRFKVADAMSPSSTVKVAVMNYYEKHEKLPGVDLQTLLKETGETMLSSPHVREITLDPGTSRIRIVIAQGALDGKSIQLTPRIENNRLVWQCRSDDVPQQHLPYECRDAVAKP